MNPEQIPLDLAFNFEKHPIHAFLYGGRPAWIAAEVGSALGMTDPNKALRSSKVVECPADYDVVPPYALPITESDSVLWSPRGVTILFESGLFALVLRSDKPAAIRFTRWVIREVLPNIRRAGSYSMIPAGFDFDTLKRPQIDLIREAGRGNRYAMSILAAKGLQPSPEEVPHG